MDIDKLKEVKAWLTPLNTDTILTPDHIRSIYTLLALATQVIEVSEAMPKKIRHSKHHNHSVRDEFCFTCHKGISGKEYSEFWTEIALTQCHDEFVLWLTKKLGDDLEKTIRKFYKGELAENDEKVWVYSLDLKDLFVLVRNHILGREK